MPKVDKNVITLGDVTAESVGKAVSFPAEYCTGWRRNS